MDRHDALRARLLALTAARPGASTRALARMAGFADSTIAYHLRRMARDGTVYSQVVGRDRCWYRAGSGLCPVLRRALPVLRRPGAMATARALTTTPASAKAIAAAACVGLGSARWAARELEDAFLAQRSVGGRVSLREGADVCVAAAARAGTCELWGRCEMSRAWRERAEDRALAIATPADLQRIDSRARP